MSNDDGERVKRGTYNDERRRITDRRKGNGDTQKKKN